MNYPKLQIEKFINFEVKDSMFTKISPEFVFFKQWPIKQRINCFILIESDEINLNMFSSKV